MMTAARPMTVSYTHLDVYKRQVKALIDRAFDKSREILARDRDKLELVAQYLLKNETMTADQFQLVYDDPAKLAAQL